MSVALVFPDVPTHMDANLWSAAMLVTWLLIVPTPHASSPRSCEPPPHGSTYSDETAVLWMGTSLTAGFGVPADSSFPAVVARIAKRRNVELHHTIAARGGATIEGAAELITPVAPPAVVGELPARPPHPGPVSFPGAV